MKFFPIKQKAMWCSLLLLQLSMALRLGITQDAKPAQWLVVDIDKIGVASDDILETAIKKVESENYAGILLKIDSPGGAVTSTKSMVKKIQMVSFPIISWVGPSGSSATSAAAILAISTPIAAMASGTIMGAATPIQATGDDIERKAICMRKLLMICPPLSSPSPKCEDAMWKSRHHLLKKQRRLPMKKLWRLKSSTLLLIVQKI